MHLIDRAKAKLNSIRRRILLAVSAAYLISSAVSAAWIYEEVSHEVDELFDAEMVQQAKTLLALLPAYVDSIGSPRQLPSVNAHAYEEKLSYRIETVGGQILIETTDAVSPEMTDFSPGFAVNTIDNQVWHRFGLVSTDGRYRILLFQQDEFRAEIRSDLTTDTVVPILTLLPLMLWLGWWTINKNFSSFRRLATALRQKRSDDYQTFAEANDTEEVALVKRALNHYLKRIEQTFLREKQFSADAAHELRTPLASLKAQLQNQRQQAATVEQKEQLEALLASTERLVLLVESLLLLSRSDLPPDNWQHVNVAAVIRQVVADYYQRAESRGLCFDVDVALQIRWCSEQNYLAILISNLVDNAIKYAQPNSTISLSNKGSAIVIKNRVEASHSIDAQRLTERFYRGGQLRVDGAGLGLSIVNNLAKQLKLSLSLRLEDSWFIAEIDVAQSNDEKVFLSPVS